MCIPVSTLRFCAGFVICFGKYIFKYNSWTLSTGWFLLLFESRLVSITRFDGTSIYSISFDEHQRFYYFYDSDDTIENLLNVFRLRLLPTSKKVQIKGTFSIVNYQPLPVDGLVEFTDTRILSTNVYSCVFFNEFVRY